MAHSSPTIPEAASSRFSVKDTLFLSKAESEQVEEGGGGVVALGAEPWPQPARPEPGRDRVSVERMGELGQRKIPGLRLSDWGSSVQQRNRWKVHREKQIQWEWTEHRTMRGRADVQRQRGATRTSQTQTKKKMKHAKWGMPQLFYEGRHKSIQAK